MISPTGLQRRSFLGIALLPLVAPRAYASPGLNRIDDGVFAYQGVDELMTAANHGAVCNIGVVIGRDATAVIDSGGTLQHARTVIDAVGKMGAPAIKYLINTHMHPDHVFGNAAFKDVTIIGHKNLPRGLEARAAFYLQSYKRQLGEEAMRGVEIIPPTQTVDRETVIDLGDRRLQLKAWKAAHTDNDLTVLDMETRTLFAGDLVFLGHLPTLDGSLLGWLRQMDELAAVPATRVVPGHGPVNSPWPDALVPQRRYFDVLTADLRSAIKSGVPLATAVTTAGRSDRANWNPVVFDEFNERNATAAYAELEWE